MTAIWVALAVLVTMSVVGPLCYLLGHRLGYAKGCREREEFEALCDEQDDELRAKDAELAKADQAIADLQRNISVVWDAGVVAGQTFQADRQEHDL